MENQDRQNGETRQRPKRQTRGRRQARGQGPTMKELFVVLGVLCVVLVCALVYEGYYESHTFQKGELAALEAGQEEKERKKFMNDNTAEPAVSEETQETGLDAEGTGESTAANAAGTSAGTASSAGPKTYVETAEGANLKNQLVGVLPGVQRPGSTSPELIAQADRMAAMYDYDRASAFLKNCSSYQTDSDMQAAVQRYQEEKAACVEYPVDQVTHIFFHTLIKDPAKAFDGDQYEAGYNQFMVTISEFNSIIQQMYEKGYVLVTLKDMYELQTGENGGQVMKRKSLMLPEGKIPFVLSQDDVCYYHYMDGDGFASRLVIDDSGRVKNEYIEDDGTVSVGDYDMIPLIDRFVEAHPDFSYRGSKGYIALTGYDGILGYRTDICYKTRENLDMYQEQFFEEHPDFSEQDYNNECAMARMVADAIKEDGWLFASHTWGHVGLGSQSTTMEQFKTDTDKWEERVEPLIGDTDTLIYAFGGDIGGVEDYAGDRFEYLKSLGFRYFCGVDSAKYWMQARDQYVRQARRNIDGYRMYYNPDMLSDLFDVSKAWDSMRPSYVPPI